MRLVRDLASVQPSGPAAVTIGVFDGVHLGHQAIINGMVDAARAADWTSVAYTFDPHPAAAIGRPAPLLLTTLEERAEILAAMGVDILVAPPFTLETARTPAAEFVDLLIRHVHMVEIWAGSDFALGHRREGDISFMKEMGQQHGFSVQVVPPVQCLDGWVSSSRIRDALLRGDIDWANACLGRPYRLRGRVTAVSPSPGLSRFPRIGLAPAPGRMVPAPGAYACRAQGEALRSQPCLATIDTQPGNARRGSSLGVYLLNAADEQSRGQLDIDFIASLEETKSEGAPGLDPLRLSADAKQALALLSGLNQDA